MIKMKIKIFLQLAHTRLSAWIFLPHRRPRKFLPSLVVCMRQCTWGSAHEATLFAAADMLRDMLFILAADSSENMNISNGQNHRKILKSHIFRDVNIQVYRPLKDRRTKLIVVDKVFRRPLESKHLDLHPLSRFHFSLLVSVAVMFVN